MTVSRSQPTTDLPWEEYDKPDLVTRQIELMRKLESARKALEKIAAWSELERTDNNNRLSGEENMYGEGVNDGLRRAGRLARLALEDITK